MVMISIPILTARKSQPGEGGVSQRTEYYTTAKVQYVIGEMVSSWVWRLEMVGILFSHILAFFSCSGLNIAGKPAV